MAVAGQDIFDQTFVRMEKISAKGIMYRLLPLMFLLQLAGLHVGAVDIIFYKNTGDCDGIGVSFHSIPAQVCCVVSPKDGGSVLVASTSESSIRSQVYRGGGCGSVVAAERGNFCLDGGQFTGAFWFNKSTHESLLDSRSCDSKMKPTGVVYTEDGTKGNWILTTSEVADLYSQMQNIPDAEKANWLQSHGATYNKL